MRRTSPAEPNPVGDASPVVEPSPVVELVETPNVDLDKLDQRKWRDLDKLDQPVALGHRSHLVRRSAPALPASGSH
jgi:hypothetical protein